MTFPLLRRLRSSDVHELADRMPSQASGEPTLIQGNPKLEPQNA
jgi:hypothetical protein